jgi:transposase
VCVCSGTTVTLYTSSDYAEEVTLRKRERRKERKRKKGKKRTEGKKKERKKKERENKRKKERNLLHSGGTTVHKLKARHTRRGVEILRITASRRTALLLPVYSIRVR